MPPKKLKAYLSGGMEYAQNEGADWREEIQTWLRAHLRHAAFNPTKESAKYLSRKVPKEDFRALKFKDLKRFTKLVAGIVDRDSGEIARRSDYVICYWDRSAHRGAGTKGELTVARLFRKPVYMVTEMKPDNIPGWVLGCVTKMFPSFRDLKLFLLKTYRSKR